MLATEADVVRSLRDGTYTLDELYARCARLADIARDHGGRPPTDAHPTDTVWKRRVRGALQALKASGRATRVERGVWALRGTRARPDRLLLILPGGALADFQLRLQSAVALLGELDEPADLVVTDPPYGLRRDGDRSSAARVYARDAPRSSRATATSTQTPTASSPSPGWRRSPARCVTRASSRSSPGPNRPPSCSTPPSKSA